ncbi:mitochondrial ribosomal protein S26 [Xylocopa sonorina]|uniref:mitochondrial ribosomal protein S26 n=1 Tax=Xylocopa sonorina TaxID=1818115 RepID=UPI00403B2A01
MIRTPIAFSVNALTVRNLNAYDHLTSYGPHIQCVRWRRKPIWLPTAKTKVFRVPTRPVIPEEDKLELKRLYNNYRTLMKSLKSFFIEQEKQRAITLDENIIKEKAEKDFEICNYINNNWNLRVAALRDERLAKEREIRKEEIAAKVQAKKERDLRLQEQVDIEIKKAKEVASTLITSENIDEAILQALENVVDHNAAIDIHGEFYNKKPKQVAYSKATD